MSDDPAQQPARIKLTLTPKGSFVRQDPTHPQLVTRSEVAIPVDGDTPPPSGQDRAVEQVVWSPALRKSLDGRTTLPKDNGLLPGGIEGVGGLGGC